MIEASAPVRICDIGGWTDTWFGGPGRVLNVAVRPGVEVSILEGEVAGTVLHLADLDERYPVVPGESRLPRHPLAEAALDALPGYDARRGIGEAASSGAIGWKVNGAGGEGGSLTILSPNEAARAAVERRVAALSGAYRVIPVKPSAQGLIVRRLPVG